MNRSGIYIVKFLFYIQLIPSSLTSFYSSMSFLSVWIVLLSTVTAVLPRVQGQPLIEAFPSTQTIPLGKSVVLVCKAPGESSTPSYQWSCPGGNCDESTSTQGTPRSRIVNENTLTVNVVSESDAGEYTCTVSVTGGDSTQTASYTLDVEGGIALYQQAARSPIAVYSSGSVFLTTNSFAAGFNGVAVKCVGPDSTSGQWFDPKGSAISTFLGANVKQEGGELFVTLLDHADYFNGNYKCKVGSEEAILGLYFRTASLPGTSGTKVANLISTQTSSSSVRLSWNQLSNAARRKARGFFVSYGIIDHDVVENVVVEGGSTTSVDLTNLQPGVEYRATVWRFGLKEAHRVVSSKASVRWTVEEPQIYPSSATAVSSTSPSEVAITSASQTVQSSPEGNTVTTSALEQSAVEITSIATSEVVSSEPQIYPSSATAVTSTSSSEVVVSVACVDNTVHVFDASNVKQFTFTGVPGRDGQNGRDGPRGPWGIQGPVGHPGAQGIEGPAGPRGGVGPPGVQGVHSPPGLPGIRGIDGLNGYPGLPGPRGRPGITTLDSNTEDSIKTDMESKLTQFISDELDKRLTRLLSLGMSVLNPADNCSQIIESNPQASSGYYWIRNSRNNSAIRMYCSVSDTPCGEGVWMRIGYVNMNDSLSQCPDPLQRVKISNRHYCYRSQHPCSTVTFDSLGKRYNKVCGFVRAYQLGHSDAFATKNINIGWYGEGISITHGTRKQHIWSYIVADDYYNSRDTDACPCSTHGTSSSVPSAMGSNYYCDSGDPGPSTGRLFTTPLWSHSSLCRSNGNCCDNPDQPWLRTAVQSSTTDSIEFHWCGDEGVGSEEAATTEIQLYIQET